MKSFLIFSGLYGLTTAILKIVGFVLFLWLAKVLSVAEFAQFGILLAIQQGIVSFGNAGVIETTIGKLKENQNSQEKEQLYKDSLGAFILLTTTVSIIGLLTFFFTVGNIDTYQTYTVVILSGLLLGLVSFRSQLYRINETHSWAVFYSFFPPFGGVIVAGICVLFFKTISSFFFGTVIGVLIPLMILELIGNNQQKLSFNNKKTLNILTNSIPYLLIAILSWLSGYGNNYIIKAFFSSEEVAKYTFLLSLCSIMLMLASALNQVWGPRFLKLINKLPFDEVENRSKIFFLILNHLLGILGGFVVLIYPLFINFIGGNVLFYQNLNLELSLMFTTYILSTPWWHCYNHFLSQGLGSSLLSISIASSTVGLFSMILLMWIFGPIGIFIGFPIQILIRSLWIIYFSQKKWKIDISWIGITTGILIIFLGLFISIINIPYFISIPIFLAISTSTIFLRAKYYSEIFTKLEIK